MSNIKDVCCKLVSVKCSIASSWMSSKLSLAGDMVTCTGHIGIHEGGGRTYVRTYVVRTDVHDVMAIKPNFLTSMGYHIFLTMVLRARGAPLLYTNSFQDTNPYFDLFIPLSLHYLKLPIVGLTTVTRVM